jgi:hypothetical protein
MLFFSFWNTENNVYNPQTTPKNIWIWLSESNGSKESITPGLDIQLFSSEWVKHEHYTSKTGYQHLWK